jgi:hypothetical protein
VLIRVGALESNDDQVWSAGCWAAPGFLSNRQQASDTANLGKKHSLQAPSRSKHNKKEGALRLP